MIISSSIMQQNHRSGSSSIPPASPFRKELKGGVSFASVKSAANAPSRVAAVRRPPISANSVSRSTTDASGAVAWSRGYKVLVPNRVTYFDSKIWNYYQSKKNKFSFSLRLLTYFSSLDPYNNLQFFLFLLLYLSFILVLIVTNFFFLTEVNTSPTSFFLVSCFCI